MSERPRDKPLLSRSRSITHRRIKEHIYQIETPRLTPREHIWIPLTDIEKLTLSGPHRRWTRELLQEHF